MSLDKFVEATNQVDIHKIFTKIIDYDGYGKLVQRSSYYLGKARDIMSTTPVHAKYLLEGITDFGKIEDIAEDGVVVGFIKWLVGSISSFVYNIFNTSFKITVDFLGNVVGLIFKMVWSCVVAICGGIMTASATVFNAIYNKIFMIDPNSKLAKESFMLRARAQFYKFWIFIKQHSTKLFAKFSNGFLKPQITLMVLSFLLISFSKSISKVYYYIKDNITGKESPQKEELNDNKEEETLIQIGFLEEMNTKNEMLFEFSISNFYTRMKNKLNAIISELVKNFKRLSRDIENNATRVQIALIMLGSVGIITSGYLIMKIGNK